MRAQACREDCPGRATASHKPAPPLTRQEEEEVVVVVKLPRRDRYDHTVYRFIPPDGSKVECTRRELNSGALD
jgi:hypothetical protein